MKRDNRQLCNPLYMLEAIRYTVTGKGENTQTKYLGNV
jgi:hypothetical protein